MYFINILVQSVLGSLGTKNRDLIETRASKKEFVGWIQGSPPEPNSRKWSWALWVLESYHMALLSVCLPLEPIVSDYSFFQCLPHSLAFLFFGEYSAYLWACTWLTVPTYPVYMVVHHHLIIVAEVVTWILSGESVPTAHSWSQGAVTRRRRSFDNPSNLNFSMGWRIWKIRPMCFLVFKNKIFAFGENTRSVQKVYSHVLWKIESFIEEDTRNIVHRKMTPQSPSK